VHSTERKRCISDSRSLEGGPSKGHETSSKDARVRKVSLSEYGFLNPSGKAFFLTLKINNGGGGRCPGEQTKAS